MRLREAAELVEAFLPPHKGGLILSHNPHKIVRETIEKYEVGISDDEEPNWVSTRERDKALKTDTMWELHWYPETPISFRVLYACSLTALLERADELRG